MRTAIACLNENIQVGLGEVLLWIRFDGIVFVELIAGGHSSDAIELDRK